MTNIRPRQHPAVHSDSKAWLAAQHGTGPNEMPSVTVDTALFPAGAKANGYVPSGVLLGRVTATGLYGPYDSAATDGRQTLRGILFQAIDTHNGDQQFGTAILVHGYVFGRKLPGGAAAATAVEANLKAVYVY